MAEFLRREIYVQDGIAYHSNRHDVLADHPIPDDFITAVLAPEHPLTVVVHEVGHATIDTFIRNGLPIPDGDDDMADAEEAFVHFLGMLSELLAEVAKGDHP